MSELELSNASVEDLISDLKLSDAIIEDLMLKLENFKNSNDSIGDETAKIIMKMCVIIMKNICEIMTKPDVFTITNSDDKDKYITNITNEVTKEFESWKYEFLAGKETNKNI